MSKISEIKELKEEFSTNLNQSDKFEQTKGIFQNFKSFCANHKLLLAGLAIPTALIINMGLSEPQTTQPKKSFDDMVVNSVQRLVDEEYDKMAKMSESEKIEYTAEKRAKLNPTRIVIHEINYDLADVNAVLAERAQGIKKEVKLGFTVIKNNKTTN
jgi:hypothetical protein